MILTTGTEAEFFKRGRQIARSLDAGGTISNESILSFEDPEDIFQLLSEKRLKLLGVIKSKPGTIDQISKRVGRDRQSVKLDIDVLVAAGLVVHCDTAFPVSAYEEVYKVAMDRLTVRLEF
jgi:predicted transcriptional regulator